MTTVTSPHDLLNALPFLIGYHPTNSLVLLSVKDDVLEMAMRIDYPIDPSDGTFKFLASHLSREGSDAALAVAYEPENIRDGESVLARLADAISANDLPIRELILVRDGKFRSLLCSDEICCPPEGSPLPDFGSSRIAAEQVSQGRVLPFDDLAGLAASIAAQPIARDFDWFEKVATFEVDEKAKNLNALQRDGAESILTLADFFISEGNCSDLDLIARVLGRITDIQVRDYALGCHDQESGDSYYQMWRRLLQMAPAGFVAPIASIFASIAYERGEGALAHRALDRALIDDADYSLAKLLRRVFATGWPPAALSKLRAELHPKVSAVIYGC